MLVLCYGIKLHITCIVCWRQATTIGNYWQLLSPNCFVIATEGSRVDPGQVNVSYISLDQRPGWGGWQCGSLHPREVVRCCPHSDSVGYTIVLFPNTSIVGLRAAITYSGWKEESHNSSNSWVWGGRDNIDHRGQNSRNAYVVELQNLPLLPLDGSKSCWDYVGIRLELGLHHFNIVFQNWMAVVK